MRLDGLKHSGSDTLCLARGRVLPAVRMALLFLLTGVAAGQEAGQPPPIRLGALTLSGSLRMRVEGWNWFLDDTRTRYAFGESLLRLALSQQRSQFDWRIELAQPTLLGLPNDALLPGTQERLGLGAAYFAANGGHRNPAGIFVKQAYVFFRGLGHNGGSLRLGRFEFADGAEGAPGVPSLAWLKRQRIAHRLIGDSYWTGAGRSLDGLHFSYDLGPSNNVTFVAARPTRGVYQADGMGEMDVDLLYAAYTRELSTRKTAAEFRLFALGYHDGRGVLKTDNRPLAARQADTRNIRVGTFGLHYLLTFPLHRLGRWDLLAWGALQTGNWGALDHRAWAFTGEIGWQPPLRWLRPWLRAGALSASADGNPNDGKHATFFQPLPTQRQYARLPFYTMQNVEDYTAQVILRPHEKFSLRGELHKVKLHGRNDLWYQGSGAFQNTSFGYEGRMGRAKGGLADFLDLSADYQVTPRLGLGFYVGALSGKATMTTLPHGRKAGFAYLEFTYRF